MAQLERISPDWTGEPCIVAAPGPSLTGEVVHTCRMARLYGWRVIAVQDSYKLMPWADALYACDEKWWNIHQTCNEFAGEKWSTHEPLGNDKLAVADKYAVRLVEGIHGSEFSFDAGKIAYGSNSGFQAVNLALLKGSRRIVLVGFDMRAVAGKMHFFGDHPKGLHNPCSFDDFARRFAAAAKVLPKDVRIVNATPDSALLCFKMLPLETAIADDSVHRDRPVTYAGADPGCAEQGLQAIRV